MEFLDEKCQVPESTEFLVRQGEQPNFVNSPCQVEALASRALVRQTALLGFM